MGDAELRVTLYLIRQTFGFRREWTPREFATNAAIMRNTGLSEQGVRNGVAAGMKAARIDRQVGPGGRGWIYRLIVRTSNDEGLTGIASPVVMVVGPVTPNDVDPQPGGPPTTLTPNDVDPLNTKTKNSFLRKEATQVPSAPSSAARRARTKTATKEQPPHSALVAALLDELGESNLNFARHVRDAKALVDAGKTENDVRHVVRWLLRTKGEFFATEPLTMTTVKKYIELAPKSGTVLPDGPMGDGRPVRRSGQPIRLGDR